VTRWLLLLQELNISVLDRLGKYNLVVDFLSRIKHEGDYIPVDDSFPNENHFSLSINMNISIKIPYQMSRNQQSEPFGKGGWPPISTWINPPSLGSNGIHCVEFPGEREKHLLNLILVRYLSCWRSHAA
jgi:hypothetical protein